MKCYKSSALLRFSSVLLALLLFFATTLGSYAQSTTNSGSTSDEDWEMTFGTFIDLVFEGYAKYVSAPYVIWDELSGGGYTTTARSYREWVHDQGLDLTIPEYWDQRVIGHHGGGYSRPSDKIDHSTEIEVPAECAQDVLNFIFFLVQENPLGYKVSKIHGYNWLGTNYFTNYKVYQTFVNYMSSLGEGLIVVYVENSSSKGYPIHVLNIKDTLEYNFYNYTTEPFDNTYIGINWTGNPTITSYINNGDITDKAFSSTTGAVVNNAGTTSQFSTVKNTVELTTTNGKHVFSHNASDETVYVFESMDAYKNYNSGRPQTYYLTDGGMSNSNWSVGSGVINTGEMITSTNNYSNIVNNIYQGMTPDQVQLLIETILKNWGNGNGGTGGGSGNGSDFNLGFLGTIGSLIGSLITGIGDLIAGIVQGIVNVLIGENGNGGIIGLVKNALTALVGLINVNITEFVGDAFDWLPSEITTLMIASITLTVLFGVIRLIRR